jgi:hypothetical protein
MSSDAFDSSTTSPAGASPPSLPSLATGSSSLAQSARLKTIKIARAVLIGFGVLVGITYAFLFSQSESEIKLVVDQQLSKSGLTRATADQVELAKYEGAALRTVRIIYASGVALGIVFIVAGALMLIYPIAATIISLTLFLGKTAVEGYLAPESLYQGLILKIVVLVTLVAAIKAAIAYQSANHDTASPTLQD